VLRVICSANPPPQAERGMARIAGVDLPREEGRGQG